MTADKRTRSDRRPTALALGLTLGALGGLLAARRLTAPQEAMPLLDRWRQALAETHGPAEAERLAGRIQVRYDELRQAHPPPASRALQTHLLENILPGLALYQALSQESDDRQVVLAQVDDLFLIGYGRMVTLMGLLRRIPAPFSLFRLLARRLMAWGFPPQGWQVEPVEDSDRAYAFNMHSCYYHNVLVANGAAELTPSFCRLDDLAAEALPPAIRFERTQTIGRGGSHCDFCYRRVSQ